MNLDYIKTFAELARVGSFSEVAKRLSLTQPAVSFQIHKLELDFGVRLINRSHKGISLTEAGKRLYEFAVDLNGKSERLLLDLAYLKEDVSGELLIATSTTPGEYILPTLLGEFLGIHRCVSAHVAVEDSTVVIDGVQQGVYELGICGVEPPKRKGLEHFKIASDEIMLVAHPAHPLARKGHISLEQIKHIDLIFREPSSGTHKTLVQLMKSYGLRLESITPRMTLGSSQAIVAAVEAQAGVAFVSSLAVRKQLESGALKSIVLGAATLKRDFYCLYFANRTATKLLSELIAFLRRKADEKKV